LLGKPFERFTTEPPKSARVDQPWLHGMAIPRLQISASAVHSMFLIYLPEDTNVSGPRDGKFEETS